LEGETSRFQSERDGGQDHGEEATEKVGGEERRKRKTHTKQDDERKKRKMDTKSDEYYFLIVHTQATRLVLLSFFLFCLLLFTFLTLVCLW